MDWNTKRKLVYAFAISALLITFFLYIFRDTLFPSPTCFDGKQNGYESGSDCGGTCSLRCSEEVIPFSVEWTRAIPTSSSTYDLVAMVSNKNIDNSSRALGYYFLVHNDSGDIVAEIIGTTTSPIDGEFPIIKQNIHLSEMPKEIVVKLTDGPHFTVAEKPTSPTLRVLNTRYEEGGIPRVYSTILNTKRLTLSNLPVNVVLYDGDNNAFAVGETVIPFLDKEESKDISFVWNRPFAQAPASIRIYPIFNPFSATQ